VAGEAGALLDWVVANFGGAAILQEMAREECKT